MTTVGWILSRARQHEALHETRELPLRLVLFGAGRFFADLSASLWIEVGDRVVPLLGRYRLVNPLSRAFSPQRQDAR